tara:strand:+ start:9581 stop:9700 length:120 start_codon:yes stop_codon:yes gene_type:complete
MNIIKFLKDRLDKIEEDSIKIVKKLEKEGIKKGNKDTKK